MAVIAVDTDIHKYGAPEVNVDLLKRPKRPVKHPVTGDLYDVGLWVNLGDNVEINNCRHKDLANATHLKAQYMGLTNINVPGNHDLDPVHGSKHTQVIKGLNVVFDHGHLGTLWEYEKGQEYVEKNKPGCGWFKYQFAKVLQWARQNIYPFRLKEKHIARIKSTLGLISKHQGFDADAIILGHSHPNEVIVDQVFANGKFVDIFILPQGRNYLTVIVNNDKYSPDINWIGVES